MRYCTSNDHSEDYDGKTASQGKVDQRIVDRFLDARDYLRHPPSLNMATEMFGDHEAQQLIDECLYNSLSEEDTIATITRITAQNILKQYQRLLQFCYPADQKVDELFICGPGARNSCIVDYLETELPESVITKPLHDIGIPGDAHEAVCYAYLALEAVLEGATHSAPPLPASNTAHPTTDIVHATVTPGTRWEELVSQVLEFSDGYRFRVATDVRISGSLETGVQRMGLR
jgi:1,6-anhydro-N-acetylmuramate kinase